MSLTREQILFLIDSIESVDEWHHAVDYSGYESVRCLWSNCGGYNFYGFELAQKNGTLKHKDDCIRQESLRILKEALDNTPEV